MITVDAALLSTGILCLCVSMLLRDGGHAASNASGIIG